MNEIESEIASTAKELNIQVKRMHLDDANRLILVILNDYCNKRYDYPLWDNIVVKSSLFDKDGWSYIEYFDYNDEVILFLEIDSGLSFFTFNNMKEVKRLIGEMVGFVFYLTNEKGEFLICFNDHDFLIGAGKAERWIRGL